MSAVWKHAPVSGGALLVLLAMADFANDNGICWPAIATLAEKARLHNRQVQYILRNLEASKLIMLDRGTGPNGVNTYKVLVRGAENAPPDVKGRGAVHAPGGAAHCTGGVLPTAPKPSLEPSLVEPSSGNGPTPLERRYSRGKGAPA